MDRKESQHFRLFLLGAFITAVMLLYMGVLYDVQVVHHEEYLASSQRSIARVETVTASRGIVTDRNGRTLVSNSSAYHLSFDKSLLKSGEDAVAEAFAAQLAAEFDLKIERRSKFRRAQLLVKGE